MTSDDAGAIDAVLSIEDLVVRYGNVVAVDEVSLTVDPGEVVALVGESGCGKSSTARAVVGIERADAGEVRYRGRVFPRLGLRRRPGWLTAVQMIFQDPNSSLNPRVRIADQVRAGTVAAHRRGVDSASPKEWLARVGLGSELAASFPSRLSGGQRQRVAIARALAARPDLLVADEPISALDASNQAAIAELLRELCVETGAGMLFISHDLLVARTVADRVAVMYRGKLVESGPASVVWSDPLHPYTRALLAAVPQPDGRGKLPAAPALQAPPEWTDHIPDALNR